MFLSSENETIISEWSFNPQTEYNSIKLILHQHPGVKVWEITLFFNINYQEQNKIRNMKNC